MTVSLSVLIIQRLAMMAALGTPCNTLAFRPPEYPNQVPASQEHGVIREEKVGLIYAIDGTRIKSWDPAWRWGRDKRAEFRVSPGPHTIEVFYSEAPPSGGMYRSVFYTAKPVKLSVVVEKGMKHFLDVDVQYERRGGIFKQQVPVSVSAVERKKEPIDGGTATNEPQKPDKSQGKPDRQSSAGAGDRDDASATAPKPDRESKSKRKKSKRKKARSRD